MQDALQAAGLTVSEAEMSMLASTEIEPEADAADKLLKLVEHLEDLDDVQNVYCNARLPE